MKCIELQNSIIKLKNWLDMFTIRLYTYKRESDIGKKQAALIKRWGTELQEIKIIREIDNIGRDSNICMFGVREGDKRSEKVNGLSL